MIFIYHSLHHRDSLKTPSAEAPCLNQAFFEPCKNDITKKGVHLVSNFLQNISTIYNDHRIGPHSNYDCFHWGFYPKDYVSEA